MDTVKVKDLKEFNKIQMNWVLEEIRAIRYNLDAIEHEATEGKISGSISTKYIFEKTAKSKSAIEEIERRSNFFNHPESK
jgi:hypothetical protein